MNPSCATQHVGNNSKDVRDLRRKGDQLFAIARKNHSQPERIDAMEARFIALHEGHDALKERCDAIREKRAALKESNEARLVELERQVAALRKDSDARNIRQHVLSEAVLRVAKLDHLQAERQQQLRIQSAVDCEANNMHLQCARWGWLRPCALL